MRVTRSRSVFLRLLRGLEVGSLLALDVGTRRIVTAPSLLLACTDQSSVCRVLR